jgi:hypothetical protein
MRWSDVFALAVMVVSLIFIIACATGMYWRFLYSWETMYYEPIHNDVPYDGELGIINERIMNEIKRDVALCLGAIGASIATLLIKQPEVKRFTCTFGLATIILPAWALLLMFPQFLVITMLTVAIAWLVSEHCKTRREQHKINKS